MFAIRLPKFFCSMILTGALLYSHAGAVRMSAYEPGKKILTQEELVVSPAADLPRMTELVGMVNQLRVSGGLSSLTLNATLSQVASIRAEEIGATGAYTHYSVTYGSAFQMMKSIGLTYQKAAENIAWGYSDTAEVVMAWMASPSHRDTLMDPAFTSIGVGYSAQNSTWCLLFQG